MKRHMLLPRVFLAVLAVLLQIANAGAAEALHLTPAEQAWLDAHPVIRIGVDAGYAPYAFIDPQGQPAGVSAELTARIAERLGVRLELVPGLSWPQILDGARQRTVDLITTAARRPDREAYLNFTRNYLPTPLVVMTRRDTPRLRSLAQLNDLSVALVTAYSSSALAMERYPQMKVLDVGTPLEGLRAVSDGRAEAYIGVLGVNTYIASRNGISNIKVNTGFSLDNGQAFGVRKDWPELVPLLEKALDSIPEAEKNEIFARWIPVSMDDISVPAATLDASMLARFAALPPLRVGVTNNRPPFDFIDKDGHHAGLAADMLALLVKHTGIKTTLVRANDSADLLQRLADGQLDLVLAATGAGPRLSTEVLSEPYFSSSLGVFVRKSNVFLGELRDLFDHPVAVRKEAVAHEILSAFPRIQLQPYPSLGDAIDALLAGKADHLVAETSSILRVIEAEGMSGLHYAGRLDEVPVRISIAVSPRVADLDMLIDAGLAAISHREATLVRRKWVGASLTEGIDPQKVWRWGATAVLLLALGAFAFFLWSRQIRRGRERFRNVVESAPNGIVLVNQAGIIRLVNAHIETMFGYPREALIGQPVEMLLPQALRAAHVGHRQRFFTAAQTRAMGEGRDLFGLRKDGSTFPLEIGLNPLPTPKGLAVLAAVIDITERKQVEAQMRELNDTLIRRSAELAIDKQRAESADRMKSVFLATMSHELRTPLNSILGFSGVLSQGLAGPLNDEQTKQLKMISGSAKHLLDLINDVLDLSKIEAEQLEVEFEHFDARAALTHALEMVAPLANAKALALTARIAPDVDQLVGDQRRFRQVLVNLLTNAVKFTEAGSVVLAAEIDEANGDGEPRLRVRITDTGIGIDRENLEHIFKPFHQIDSGSTRQQDGTGLGLSICKKLVGLLGGEISVSSEPGRGTSFEIWLPLTNKARHATRRGNAQ